MELDVEKTQSTVEPEEIDAEYIARVQNAFNFLEKDEATAVMLCDIKGYTPEDVAVKYNVPENLVSSLVLKGRRRLKSIVESLG